MTNNINLFLNPFELYNIPLDDWISAAIDFLVNNFRPLFQAIRFPVSLALDGIEWLFLAIPPLIFLLIIGLIVWQLAGRAIAIYSVIALTLIGFLGIWEEAMVSLALVMTAVAFCTVVGIPVGIASAKSDRVDGLVKPLLDVMQTIPSFVYLVPVVMLFGIGKIPGVMATFIVAVPPLIRLTNLGIRQVSLEVVEAAQSFGSTPSQLLWEVQIPLALPTILAGLNQTVLLALAMSVVTSMIAVPGLGLIVLQGVGRLDVGLAAVGGLGIVLIAVMLDRVAQAVGKSNSQLPWKQRGPIGFLLSQSGSQKLTSVSITLAFFLTLYAGLFTGQPTTQATIEATTPEIAMPGQGMMVSSGVGTTTSSRFLTEVLNLGLSNLGYRIKEQQLSSIPTMHIGVVQGDLDFYGSHWETLHEPFFQKNGGEENLERVGTILSNTLQGYQIDKKTADEYHITNLKQLQDPKIAKLFDSDGNGKANLIGCIPGWSCESVIDHHLQAYELKDTVEHIQGDYSALMGDILTRHQQGKPILYYAWTPNWIASLLEPGKDAVWLEVPFTSLPQEQGELGEQDTSVEGKNLGFAVDQVRVLANKKFLNANPSAKRWFELVQIPIEEVNAQQKLVQQGENKPADIRRHAQDWINHHQQLFDSWVGEARLVYSSSVL
ncbi:MAG: glycine betaine/L-proline ABC transporter substrate-binding protein ProX [Symploca sp. SIO2D2]|nr:glycine betaine/L-proline ABC transporter substrate-binding protein ProX [Symploca sp. SIO2D2]NER22072.1 glycine betaine/L-proline ABC transporter substrate-binding protein ProX [Symploca sp. SIO1C2]